jgi:hypothetical protein
MSLEHGSGGGAAGCPPEDRGAGTEEAGSPDPSAIRRVLYLPARPLPDGREILALSPLEFLAALARLIPPPRVHRHRYHGVLAPNAHLRSRVVALAKEHTAALALEKSAPDLRGPALEECASSEGRAAAATGPLDSAVAALTDPARSAAPSRWARLIARIYEVSPLTCPGCGAEMRILAFITDPAPIVAILRHLNLPTRPPALSPARGPPQPDLPLDGEPPLDLDQTPAFDPAEPELLPEADFDQSWGA